MNNYLLAIDPSLRSTGVALFLNEKLISADFFKTPTKLKRYNAMVYACDRMHVFMADCIGIDTLHCVVEEQVHRKDEERMSMDDFVRLASLSYMIIPSYVRNNTTFVKPSTWKRSVPEDIMARRIYNHELTKDTAFELIADVQFDKMHAIGLGRWWYANIKKG